MTDTDKAKKLVEKCLARHLFKTTKDGPIFDQGVVDDLAALLAAERANANQTGYNEGRDYSMQRIADERAAVEDELATDFKAMRLEAVAAEREALVAWCEESARHCEVDCTRCPMCSAFLRLAAAIRSRGEGK